VNLPSDAALAITHRELRRLLDLYQPPPKQRASTGTRRASVAKQRSATAGVGTTDHRDQPKETR